MLELRHLFGFVFLIAGIALHAAFAHLGGAAVVILLVALCAAVVWSTYRARSGAIRALPATPPPTSDPPRALIARSRHWTPGSPRAPTAALAVHA